MFKNYLFKNYFFFSVATELSSAHYRLPFSSILPQMFVPNIPPKTLLGNLNYKTHFRSNNFFLGGGIKIKGISTLLLSHFSFKILSK
jgi:hypothetical protein